MRLREHLISANNVPGLGLWGLGLGELGSGELGLDEINGTYVVHSLNEKSRYTD